MRDRLVRSAIAWTVPFGIEIGLLGLHEGDVAQEAEIATRIRQEIERLLPVDFGAVERRALLVDRWS